MEDCNTVKSNEMMAHTYSHLYGIQTTELMFLTAYGSWRMTGVLS